jgi:transcriptional regulator with XRE-family HTH domain
MQTTCARCICATDPRGYKHRRIAYPRRRATGGARRQTTESALSRPLAAKAAPVDATAPRVGRRVKQLRLAQGMRLKDLATAAGCSESLLSRVENNLTSPSLATMHRLAKALGVSMVALFDASSPDGVVISTPKDRIVIGRGFPGEQNEVLIPHAENRLLEGFIVTLMPGAEPSGPYQHDGEEVGVILEGELELTVGESLHVLRAGDSFFFRSDVTHRYRNVGEGPCRVVWINTPPTF